MFIRDPLSLKISETKKLKSAKDSENENEVRKKGFMA